MNEQCCSCKLILLIFFRIRVAFEQICSLMMMINVSTSADACACGLSFYICADSSHSLICFDTVECAAA